MIVPDTSAGQPAIDIEERLLEDEFRPEEATAMADISADGPSALRAATVLGRLPLQLRTPEGGDGFLHDDLSAVAWSADGRSLWVASDETAAVERLAYLGSRDAGYGDHRRFELAELLELPGAPGEEADVEGLSVDGGYLWVVGSHSLARRKPKTGKAGSVETSPEARAAALERLTEVKREQNRFLLARVPLVREGEQDTLAATVETDGAVRRAARLKMGKGRNALVDALEGDVHIGRFLDVPAKENGFDIEGVCAAGDRVFLGLRGPVLRGWAVVLEVRVRETKRGRLKLVPQGNSDALVRKHFLNLDGLGIRAMVRRGGDLWLLAGPTMDLDGPVRLYRWRDALADEADASVADRPSVTRILDLPFGEDCDHAEGATVMTLPGEDDPVLMVVYDSPADDRHLSDGGGALADLIALPDA